MATRTAVFGKGNGAMSGIATQRLGGNFAERADIGGNVGNFFFAEKPTVRHFRGNAFGNDGLQSIVIRREKELRAVQIGTASAFAVHAVAKSTVAFKQAFA